MMSGHTEEQTTGACDLCRKARPIAHMRFVRTVASPKASTLSTVGLATRKPLSGLYGPREHTYGVCGVCFTAPRVVLVLAGAVGMVNVVVSLAYENIEWCLVSTLGTFAAISLLGLRQVYFRVLRKAVKERSALFAHLPRSGKPKIVATFYSPEMEKRRADAMTQVIEAGGGAGIEVAIGTGNVRHEACDLASQLAGGWPPELDRARFLAVDFDALVATLRRYQHMTHPGGTERPEYRPVPGQLARVSYPHEDIKIATTASMLAGKAKIKPFDVAASDFAYKVIQEYGGWRLAKFLFFIPRSLDLQAGGPSGRKIIVMDDFIIDTYSGMENLLFEIYEELAEGELFDDARVRRKLLALACS